MKIEDLMEEKESAINEIEVRLKNVLLELGQVQEKHNSHMRPCALLSKHLESIIKKISKFANRLYSDV